jgi:hypothetical protein
MPAAVALSRLVRGDSESRARADARLSVRSESVAPPPSSYGTPPPLALHSEQALLAARGAASARLTVVKIDANTGKVEEVDS